MEKGIKINGSQCSKYSNALHADFHERMYTLVESGIVELSVIHLTPEFMAEWHELIDLEQQICGQTATSVNTVPMNKQDGVRDGFLTYLYHQVDTGELSPFPNISEAARRAATVTDHYKGIQNLSMYEETERIKGLLIDLRAPKFAQDVETLGLTETLDGLEAANEAFIVLREERSTDTAHEKLPTGKEVRRRMDPYLERLALCVEASYLFSDSAEDKAAIAELALQMNQRIADAKATHNKGFAQRNGAGTAGGSAVNPGGTMPEDNTGGDGSNGPDGADEPTPDEGGSEGETPEGGGTPPPTTGGNDDDEEVVG